MEHLWHSSRGITFLPPSNDKSWRVSQGLVFLDASRIQENPLTPKYAELNTEVPSTHAGMFSSQTRTATRSPRSENINIGPSNGAFESGGQVAIGGAHSSKLSGSLTQTGCLPFHPDNKTVGSGPLDLSDTSLRKKLRDGEPNTPQWQTRSSGFPKKPRTSHRTPTAQSSCYSVVEVAPKRTKIDFNANSNRSTQREREEKDSQHLEINCRQTRRRALPKSPKVRYDVDCPDAKEAFGMTTESRSLGPTFLFLIHCKNN